MYLSIALSLNKLFGMFLGTDAAAPKTKAQLLEECLTKLSYAKGRAVLVGDSKYDAEGALQAGIDFIAVTYWFGFRSDIDTAAYSPAAVCRTAEEIDGILHKEQMIFSAARCAADFMFKRKNAPADSARSERLKAIFLVVS